MSMQYIRTCYGVPARLRGRVRYRGRPGVIVGSRGAYLRIRLDGERQSKLHHPTYELEYVGGRR